ncbi:MAG: NUDIX hydrolase [Bdellovibrionales bacterium]
MKIPPHATRVFKGIIFDIYQWQQEMYDGSTRTFEAAKRYPTIEIIVLDGDDIIFSKQEQPGIPEYYSFLGGRGEEGETPLETAKRELLEEAGLECDTWHEFRQYPFPGKLEWVVYLFIASGCRKVAEPALDGGEILQLQRMPLKEFLQTIVPQATFHSGEFRSEVMSAFNQPVTDSLYQEILSLAGKTKE